MDEKIPLPATLVVEDPRQRRALASPLRLELVGQFTAGYPMSVAELAGRMGRSAASLYHHVRKLEGVGLLQRAGERVEGGRPKALYLPVARSFQLGADPADAEGRGDILKTLATAFRMAHSELDEALQDPDRDQDGPTREVYATRLHARLTPAALAKLNGHIDAMMELLLEEGQHDEIPDDAEHFVSLTLALLPLRNREPH